MAASAVNPSAASPSRPGTMNHMVVVLGDTSINAFETSGILEANLNICAVLASSV